MSRPRIGLWVLVSLLLLFLAVGLYIRQAWHAARETYGIENLESSGLDLGLGGLNLERGKLVRVQEGRRLAVQVDGLSLTWQWEWRGPQLDALDIDQLEVDWQSYAATDDDEPLSAGRTVDEMLRQETGEAPRWLPRTVTVEGLRVRMPCATGVCLLGGSLAAARRSRNLAPLTFTLSLEREAHYFELQGDLSDSGTETRELSLEAELLVDGNRHLVLASDYRVAGGAAVSVWSGSLDIPALPQTGWLLDWLREWQPGAENPLPTRPEAASFNAQWQLQAPSNGSFAKAADGSLKVNANLPQPWPLPGIATLEGDLQLGLRAEQGSWLAETARADLRLSNPGPWVDQLPEPLRPGTLSVTVRPASEAPAASPSRRLLPVTLNMASTEPARFNVESHLALSTGAPWFVQLGRTRVQASLPSLTESGWVARRVSADLRLTGRADSGKLSLDFDGGSGLRAEHLDLSGMEAAFWLDGLAANLQGLRLDANYELAGGELTRLSLSGPLEVSAERLRHPVLRQQAWQYGGELEAGLEGVQLDGTLNNAAGLKVDVSLDKTMEGPLLASLDTRLSMREGSNTLAATLAQWPAPLSIEEGVLSISSRLRIPAGGDPEVRSMFDVDGLSGLHDRTAWSGVTGSVMLDINERMLEARTAGLEVGQVNPGMPVGPIQFEGSYRASLEKPLGGELDLAKAEADFLGGDVWIRPGVWDLQSLPVLVPLLVREIELSELMTLYPAEGLHGTGKLSGRLPVSVGTRGVSLERGQITAEKPGGVLKLPADRIRSFARDNTALEMVAGAMDNFHYSVLASEVEYTQNGTLLLDLRLEGRNPDFRDGQPIHFNITLEEDIPALLTSLQLSGRVSDAVTERVREMIRKEDAGDIERE